MADCSTVLPGLRIDYWKSVRVADGTLSRIAVAPREYADHADISCGPLSSPIKLALTPDNKVIIDKMIEIAEKAYASGKWDAKAELRDWLKG